MAEKIETEAEHKAALTRIELLFNAPEGSPEYEELIRLADLANAYEDIHYPRIWRTLTKTFTTQWGET